MSGITLNYIVLTLTNEEQALFVKFLRRGMLMEEAYEAALEESLIECPHGHYYLETDADGECPYCES